jgi:replicative DNA helicase
MNNGGMGLLATLIRPDHFGLESHQQIFRAMLRLHGRNAAIDHATIAAELPGGAESVGGSGYIMELAEGTYRFSESTLQTYCQHIRSAWKARQVAQLGASLEVEAADELASMDSLIAEAQTRLEAIACDGVEPNATADQIADGVLATWEKEHQLTASPAIGFGIETLDEAIGGMFPGHQVVVGARSGVGKTRFLVMATAAVCACGFPAQMNLIEPTRDEFMRGLAVFAAGLRASVATEPWQVTRAERDSFHQSMQQIRKWPLTIYDRASMTLDEIIARGRAAIHRGCRLIGVDYLQRVNIPSLEKGEQIRLKVARASTSIANLVKDTCCTSVVLSQLRRTETMGIPTMQDLRESGQIENDAHTIVLLHREYDSEKGIFLNTGAYVVPKRRFGPPASRRAYFDPTMATWGNGSPTKAEQDSWQDRGGN